MNTFTHTRAEQCAECGEVHRECKLVRCYALGGKIGWKCYPCRQKAWHMQRVQALNHETLDVGYY
jgi:hypothetical protein